LKPSANPDADAFVAGLSDAEVEALALDWQLWARPEQLPPDGEWTTWLMLGGRGSGKTRAGAEWVRARARDPELGGPIALVGETMEQARAVMVEGESGLLAICPEAERPKLDRSRNALFWPNGAEAHLMSGSEPERFRGPQFAAAWCDDLYRRRADAGHRHRPDDRRRPAGLRGPVGDAASDGGTGGGLFAQGDHLRQRGIVAAVRGVHDAIGPSAFV